VRVKEREKEIPVSVVTQPCGHVDYPVWIQNAANSTTLTSSERPNKAREQEIWLWRREQTDSSNYLCPLTAVYGWRPRLSHMQHWRHLFKQNLSFLPVLIWYHCLQYTSWLLDDPNLLQSLYCNKQSIFSSMVFLTIQYPCHCFSHNCYKWLYLEWVLRIQQGYQ
jgi:hypothetical protein